ncbi:MAG: intradiol ring-cleavage dioxygenase [Bacteroidetes bacterium]|nr:intradiol ring-cleavage dioxygenase [Bacteroidota bacterium]
MKILSALVLSSFLMSCNGQNQNNTSLSTTESSTERVGGECEEGYCELIYFGMPENINSTDTSAGWYEKGQKLIVTGTAFQLDGKTPAPNVIIYYHHTDNDGYYSTRNDKPENQTRHGHIRGWVKTDANGKYTIKTNRPAPYPDGSEPAHIHWLIKEPVVKNEYWTDDLYFDDDKLLLPHIKKKKKPFENRGGSGIARILLKDSLQIVEHDFVLGLNIPNYPKKTNDTKQSGLHIGEDQPSFIPFHAFGLDKGTQTCPVCKYGRYHGIIYFVGNNPNWTEIKKWLQFLEQESEKRKKYLKVYFVYGNDKNYNKTERQKQLENLGNELNLKNTALTFVPSFSDKGTEANLNKINPEVENTFIIYKHRSIVDKYIELKPTDENFKMLSNVLDNTQGEYFDLPEPEYD